MADLKLDILVVPTYNLNLLNITDASIYSDPLTVTSPTIEITVPGFNRVLLPFTIQKPNVFNSVILELSEPGEYLSLPDGIYNIKYSIAPAQDNFITRSIFRTEKLQEKFDNAFMQLDMMECDRAIKEQSQVKLNTINIFIQGAIASANNCANIEAMKLYEKADKMLTTFIKKDCNSTGNNY